MWEAGQAGQAGQTRLISGAPTDPSSPTGITRYSDCYEPTISDDGRFVAMRCSRKQHPDGFTPTSSTGYTYEGWMYDRQANTLSLFAPIGSGSRCAFDTASRAELATRLQSFWGSSQDLTAAGVTSATSSSCGFAAAVGLQSGKNVGNMAGANSLSMDGSGRFVVYTSDFQMASLFGTHDKRLPVTEYNVFMYDRLVRSWASDPRHCTAHC